MWQIVCWLLTGFGVIAILSIGAPFLLLGLILIAIGTWRVGPRGIWAALIGFGALLASIMIWDVTSMPWACQGGQALPNVNYFSCVDTPFGLLTAYHVMALIFGLVALVGLVWPLARMVWTRTNSNMAYPSS